MKPARAMDYMSKEKCCRRFPTCSVMTAGLLVLLSYARLYLFMLLALLFASVYSYGADEPVGASLISEDLSIQPGREFLVAIKIDIEEGWHIYGHDAKEDGMPSQIYWDLPKGFSVVTTSWPQTEHFDVGGIAGKGYSGTILIISKVMSNKDVVTSDTVDIAAKVSWGACRDMCMPGGLR